MLSSLGEVDQWGERTVYSDSLTTQNVSEFGAMNCPTLKQWAETRSGQVRGDAGDQCRIAERVTDFHAGLVQPALKRGLANTRDPGGLAC
jgi:hypothetical protein